MLKNIIILCDYAQIEGGAAKVAHESAIALAEKYNVILFTAVGEISEELKKSRVKVVCLAQYDILNNPSRLKAIKQGVWNSVSEKAMYDLLKQYSSDDTIIHVHTWTKALSVAPIAVADELGFKIVFTLHDYFSVCPNGGFYNYRKGEICKLPGMCTSCVLTNCDKRNYDQKLWRCLRQKVQDKYVRNNPNLAFISISDKVEQIIKPLVASKNFYRVDNPVNISGSFNVERNDNKTFLYAGRVSEEKGVDVFCNAFTALKKKYPDIKAIVVGNGEILENLKMQFTDVTFVGWKNSEEVKQYMQEARALVFPSKWYETFGLTALEAMSAGLPCIVSDCTATTEKIKHEENGLIFASCNVEDLQKCMGETLDDEVLRKFIKGIKESLDIERYSLKRHCERLVEVYEEWMRGI